jgi:hypothetical protein
MSLTAFEEEMECEQDRTEANRHYRGRVERSSGACQHLVAAKHATSHQQHDARAQQGYGHAEQRISHFAYGASLGG